MEEWLHEIHSDHTLQNERQDAMIDQMEKMVAYMENTDRHACEAALLADLSDVYPKLAPEARALVLATEQIRRISAFPLCQHD
jgi:DNA-binding GntR family transcriptional regulator